MATERNENWKANEEKRKGEEEEKINKKDGEERMKAMTKCAARGQLTGNQQADERKRNRHASQKKEMLLLIAGKCIRDGPG